MNNILPQFSKANGGRKNKGSQKDFEKIVSTWLKDANTKVFYEVQPIFCSKNDTMPIGNRILAINLNNFSQFHVFIPNFSDENINNHKSFSYNKIYKPLYHQIMMKSK